MNIVLIGMPGSGKSTIGVLLAKRLLMEFCDTDLLIQSKYGKSLSEIISEYGEEGFIRTEEETLRALACDNTVIATGGSAVLSGKAMEYLRQFGKTVYLELTLEEIQNRINNINTRGIVMKNGSLASVYQERVPLYTAYADYRVNCSGHTIEECVKEVSALFK